MTFWLTAAVAPSARVQLELPCVVIVTLNAWLAMTSAGKLIAWTDYISGFAQPTTRCHPFGSAAAPRY